MWCLDPPTMVCINILVWALIVNILMFVGAGPTILIEFSLPSQLVHRVLPLLERIQLNTLSNCLLRWCLYGRNVAGRRVKRRNYTRNKHRRPAWGDDGESCTGTYCRCLMPEDSCASLVSVNIWKADSIGTPYHQWLSLRGMTSRLHTQNWNSCGLNFDITGWYVLDSKIILLASTPFSVYTSFRNFYQ